MDRLLAVSVLLTLTLAVLGIPRVPKPYVDTSDPYKLGKLSNGTFPLTKRNGSLVHTTVIYPQEAGSYPLFYFVPGGPEGIVPAEWYTDFLTRVVSHGFIAAAVDPFYPALNKPKALDSFTAFSLANQSLHQLQWLKDNLKKHLPNGVQLAANSAAVGCHSAGCDVTLRMVQTNELAVQSTLFLEPFSVAAKKKSGIKVPAYMYGTQFSEQFGPFPCSIPGVDYKTFYQQWGCPKWLTEVSNFGHCDILDNFAWEACHIGHFCKTVGNWSRVYPAYHEYVSGAASAFLIGTLQNYTPAFNYIENQQQMPQKMLLMNHTNSC